MKSTDAMPGSAERSSLLGTFVRWYIVKKPTRIVQTYITYAKTTSEMFSIIFLLRTLFSPWKNIKDAYPTKGFNLRVIAETLTLNMTTRIIGAIIRLGAIVLGVVVQILLLAGFAAYLAVWMLYPFFLIIALPLLFTLSLA